MDKETIDSLVRRAVVAELDGCDFLSIFDYEELAREYNGIGPEWLPEKWRAKASDYFELFAPAALIHDMRYSRSDGMRYAFNFANMEFRDNCLKLANAAYPWYSWKRYRARAVALFLFDCVDCTCGWIAWLDASRKNLTRAETSHKGADGIPAPFRPSETPGGSLPLRENSLAVLALFAAILLFAGCATAPKAKDVNLKGMYANAATETVAIGTAKITMLPESLESFVAHYSEDTAWLRPSEKTHALDIYMTGTNCTSSASKVVDAICKAFVEKKTPTTVGQMSAEVEGASAAGTTPPEDSEEKK